MDRVGTKVFFGTLERGNADLFSRVMADPKAAAVIKGIGVQWAGKGALPLLRARFPDIELWGSEQECGIGTNDWHYARYGWATIKRYFEAGASAWEYWNLAMPEGGWSGAGAGPQNSLVVVRSREPGLIASPKTTGCCAMSRAWWSRAPAPFRCRASSASTTSWPSAIPMARWC